MINLLPRKKFELTLLDGTVITGQFGTWCLKRFCDRRGYKLSEVGDKLNSPELGDICDLILSAVEQSAREGGHPFSYTDVHACKWIDELGGMASEDFLKLMMWSGSEEPATEDEQKKSLLSGESSSEQAA
jgi:hypothetical protein